MKKTKVYRSLLYQNHFLGIPEDWIAISISTLAILYSITIPIYIVIAVFIFLMFTGRQIYLHKSKDFASIIRMKLMTNSFVSSKFLEIKPHENKYLSHYKEVKILLENIILNLFTLNFNKNNKTKILKKLETIKNLIKFIKIKLNFLENLDNTNHLRLMTISQVNNNIIYKKNGEISIVILLTGVNDNIINFEEEIINYNIRKSTIENLHHYIKFSYYTIRMLKETQIDDIKIKNQTANKINKIWNTTFSNHFINKNYLILTHKKTGGNLEKRVKSLKNIANDILNKLNIYQAKLLTEPQTIGFITTLLNGKFQEKINYKNNKVENLFYNPFKIIDSGIQYNNNKYSTFLNFKDIPKTLSEYFSKIILQTNIEMFYFFHCETRAQQQMLEMIGRKQKRQQTLESPVETQQELLEIKDLIDQGQIYLLFFNMGIQIFANSKNELENNVNEIQKIFSNEGINIQNQKQNILGYYYSLCLENKYHSSKRILTSENVATLFTPFKDHTGFNKCSFGTKTSQFFTNNGNIYNFTFHKSPEANALGHTLIVGKSGVGKSVLISFLLSQALRHENMSILALDQLKGLKIPILALGGKYYTLGQNNGINPFILEKTSENNAFIKNFIKIMLEPQNNDEELRINTAVTNFTKGKKNTINLKELSVHLGAENNNLRQKLNEYINGNLKNHFDNKNNSFELGEITGFNMEQIAKDDGTLTPLYTYYLYQLFITKNRNNKGILFFDEMATYLKNQEFEKLIFSFLEQIRKTNKILIGALQSFAQLNSKQFKNIKPNIATYLLFPIGNSSEDEIQIYKDIGLNNKQINFLTQSQPNARKILIYKPDGYSNIINVDLNYLDDYLNIFTSDSNKIKIIENYLEEKNTEDITAKKIIELIK